jgi:hypothetical protein
MKEQKSKAFPIIYPNAAGIDIFMKSAILYLLFLFLMLDTKKIFMNKCKNTFFANFLLCWSSFDHQPIGLYIFFVLEQ